MMQVFLILLIFKLISKLEDKEKFLELYRLIRIKYLNKSKQ